MSHTQEHSKRSWRKPVIALTTAGIILLVVWGIRVVAVSVGSSYSIYKHQRKVQKTEKTIHASSVKEQMIGVTSSPQEDWQELTVYPYNVFCSEVIKIKVKGIDGIFTLDPNTNNLTDNRLILPMNLTNRKYFKVWTDTAEFDNVILKPRK